MAFNNGSSIFANVPVEGFPVNIGLIMNTDRSMCVSSRDYFHSPVY